VALYRYLFLTLAFPVVALRIALALLMGRERPADLWQRLGRSAAPVARGPVIWLHAASVGEVNAARALAETLLAREPRLSLVVTCNSVTGRARAADWGLDRVTARLAPLDYRWALIGFFAAWQPAALVTVENEIWPNRLAMARARRLPVMVAGARLSARSALIWRRVPKTAKTVIGLIDHLAAQDGASEERLERLGLPRGRLGPRLNLKSAVRLVAVEDAELQPFAAALPYPETLLAASTHPGEEALVLEAFTAAFRRNPHLRLILAPRHPERGDEVAGLIAAHRLTCARRSAGQMPGPDTQVFLADTLGEMALWYHLAAVTFVGGSLVDKGGHNPYEAAAEGTAILHGPFLANARAAYAALDAGGGAVPVRDADGIAAALADLAPEARRAELAAAATRALGDAAQGDGVEAVLTALARELPRPQLAPVAD
jgi:3-deoxy-D-manno-octulosonic-acid transferase